MSTTQPTRRRSSQTKTQAALNTKEAVIVTASPLVKGYQVGGPNDGKMLLSLDTAAVYTVGSLKATGNAEIDGLLTVDSVVAGALSCSQGFFATSGQNGISMNMNDTEVNGPVTFLGPVAASSLDVAGDVTGGGFGAFFDAYSVTALGKKENVITAASPLVKTTPYGYTQLSLDTGAAYTLGALNVTGSTNLHTTALSRCRDHRLNWRRHPESHRRWQHQHKHCKYDTDAHRRWIG